MVIEEKIEFDFNKRFSPKRKEEFAQILINLKAKMGMKISSRGWGYILEQNGYINKNQFDRVADAINDLRRKGIIPVDFIEEDEARDFQGVNYPDSYNIEKLVSRNLEDVLDGSYHYHADYWENERYYIQCIVEKVDVRNLFAPTCEKYHIPIANARGWSSISQRAIYARRFKQAEDDGKICVLLYCGDHDPDGLRISDTIRKNLEQIKDITWEDGEKGYDPADLIVHRFGLQYEYIIKHGLLWIDNLITGNTNKHMDLGDPKHPNHSLPYVQDYLKKVGRRKCESNALIVTPDAARTLMEETIGEFLDRAAFIRRCEDKEREIADRYEIALQKTGARPFIEKIIRGDYENDGTGEDETED